MMGRKMKSVWLFSCTVLWLGLAATIAVAQPNQPAAPAVDPLADSAVFRTVVRRQGDDGVHTYRIPGLVTTTKGTLVAVFDLRHTSSADLPGDIDVGMMRSTDHGKTWSGVTKILDFDKNEKNSRSNGVGDPSILVDTKTGRLFVAALWSKGNRAWNGSGPGLTPEETGQFVLTQSDDDGVTWSKPLNISATTKGRDAKWRLFFNGPGNGIQLRDGTLIFAAQYRAADGPPHSCFIYSKDGGENWSVSTAAIADKPPTSEAQIAELSDGSLLLSMRDESRSGKRAWARYTFKDDIGKGTWSDHWLDVPDPTCMASLIRHPSGALLFSNPNSAKSRVAMTVRWSEDDGKTWSAGRLLDPRGSMYSSMTVLADGSIGILYEGIDDKKVGCLHFAQFPMEWVTGAAKARPGALRWSVSPFAFDQQDEP